MTSSDQIPDQTAFETPLISDDHQRVCFQDTELENGPTSLLCRHISEVQESAEAECRRSQCKDKFAFLTHDQLDQLLANGSRQFWCYMLCCLQPLYRICQCH